MKFKKSLIPLLCAAALSGTSCSSSDEPDPVSKDRNQTVLIYAVVADLEDFFKEDQKEITEAGKDIDLDRNTVLVYESTTDGIPTLSELVRLPGGSYGLKEVKTYDKSHYSTDPVRISEVISDAKSLRPARKYGLFLWSHGTGIDPAFSNHPTAVPKSGTAAAGEPAYAGENWCFSFGADRNPNISSSFTDRTDIPELAGAIPDGMFEYIWFDDCYMSGIEIAYEMKNKCKSMIAYPTEVWGPGAPYDLVLPPLLQTEPQVKEAAEKFFEYYNENPDASMRNATIAVTDMSKAGAVASAARKAYANSTTPSTLGVQKYTRMSVGPFYDFGQISRLRAENAGNDAALRELDDALGQFVVYKAATARDFSNKAIDQSNYSGLATHNFNPASSTAYSAFYRTLKWYGAVFE